MYEWISGAILGALVLVSLKTFQIIKVVESMLVLAADSLKVIGSKKFTDLEKERKLQENTLPILGRLCLVFLVFLLSFAISAFVVFILWRYFYSSEIDFFHSDLYTSWQFLFGSTVASLILWTVYEKVQVQKPSYSIWQRMLHKMAFASIGIQMRFLQRKKSREGTTGTRLNEKAPIFITGLPRAGTTILLKELYKRGPFVSLTYRDMPFILLPNQWRWINSWFSKKAQLKPRPHGDGILVSVDSPEALDEVVWKVAMEEVEEEDRKPFIRSYVEKILAREKLPGTYLSKNNALLNRLGFLKDVFPEATVVCLFRNPLEQAASLWKQHLHFLELQQSDHFVLEYMTDIGQSYFGQGMEVKRFGDWPGAATYKDPLELNFWLEYWMYAYGLVLKEHRRDLLLVSYEKLCEVSARSLQKVAAAAAIEVDTDGEIGILLKPSHEISDAEVDQKLLSGALSLYQELKEAEQKQEA